MLFDLRGKRRRTVQVTYAGLALLMGVGLVGAGIGSDVSGGLFDIFTGNDSGDVSDANKETEKRVKAAEKRLAANPKDQAAVAQVIRGRYTIAASDTDRTTGQFGDDGKKELGKAAAAWEKYLAAEPEKPHDGLASLMLQAYAPNALNKPDKATQAAEIVAGARDNTESYLTLVQYATLAGQKRKADLAADKALELAPKGERKNVEELIKQAKAVGQPAPGGGGTDDAAPVPGGGE
jgi:hypothetical protein